MKMLRMVLVVCCQNPASPIRPANVVAMREGAVSCNGLIAPAWHRISSRRTAETSSPIRMLVELRLTGRRLPSPSWIRRAATPRDGW